MLKTFKNTYFIVLLFCTMVADVRGMNIYGVYDEQKKMTSKLPSDKKKELSGVGNSMQDGARSYTLKAAGVLPIIYNEKHSQTKMILGRRTEVGTVNLGKYDYFAGAVDQKDDGDSVVAAAKGWNKESRLSAILGWDKSKTRQFIKMHVKGYVILATRWINKENTYVVMYLVDIGQDDISEKLFKNFEPSYQEFLQYKESGDPRWNAFLKKDKLIEVKWGDLLQSIISKGVKPLIAMKSSGDVDNEAIKLSGLFSFLLQGIDSRYRVQSAESKTQFPLGVFIFASEQLEETGFKVVSLTSEEKAGLNAQVMSQLATNQVDEQEPMAEQVSDIKVIEQALKNPSEAKEQQRKIDEEQPIAQKEKKQKELSPEQRSAIAKTVKERQTKKGIVEQPNPGASPVSQKNDGIFSSIGESIWLRITNLADLVSDFFNWLGRGFPQ